VKRKRKLNLTVRQHPVDAASPSATGLLTKLRYFVSGGVEGSGLCKRVLRLQYVADFVGKCRG
jgi:hypothetical protein